MKINKKRWIKPSIVAVSIKKYTSSGAHSTKEAGVAKS